MIKQIPLLDCSGVDKLCWWRSRNGEYSVQSGYYSTMEVLIDNHHFRKPGDWMRIWKLNIPPKFKLLLWRVARGCLPTRINLRKKHVPCVDTCLMCEGAIEDECKLFFECSTATVIWNNTGCWNMMQDTMRELPSFNECFFKMLNILTRQDKIVFATMFWVL